MSLIKTIAESKAGKVAVVIVVIAAAIFIFREGRTLFGEGSVAAAANDRWFVDSTTMKPFRANLEDLIGQTVPIQAPSGGKTGYPAELCYWTSDGHVKKDPTPVLLNSSISKPGPTFCPDCGRLVVFHNPVPVEGDRPPPTAGEWKGTHPAR